MTRPKGNNHGGPRVGTQGASYSNRTDLNANPDRVAPTPQPSSGPPAASPAPAPESWVSPDEVTPLDAPSDRPNEPITAGLPFGPGAGPPQPSTRADLMAMKKHLPYLKPLLDDPNTPESVRSFTNYLISQVGS